MMIVKQKFLAFTLVSVLFITNYAIVAADDASQNEISRYYQNIMKKKTVGYPEHPCNLCIDEDSIVGLPNKKLIDGWTCGMMELEAFEMDASDASCRQVQNHAKRCRCQSIGGGGGGRGGINLMTTDGKNIQKDNSYQQDIMKEQAKDVEKLIKETRGITKSRDANFDDEDTLLSQKSTVVLSNIFLFFLIFAISATTSMSRLYMMRHALVIGFIMNFGIMPLAGFMVVLLLKDTDASFTQAMGMTLLVVASSPGGSFSNWWCSLFNADVELSEAMTFVSTLLSFTILPISLIFYSKLAYGSLDDSEYGHFIDYNGMCSTLGLMMIALLLGHFVSFMMHGKAFKRIVDRLAWLSSMGLILLFLLLSSVGAEDTFWNQDKRIYAGIFFINVLAVFLMNCFSWSFLLFLEKAECVTLSVECCYKNTAIAMSMALSMFPDPKEKAQALAIVIIYTLLQKITMLGYWYIAWKSDWTNAPADESVWLVLSNDYGAHDIHDSSVDSKLLKQVTDSFLNPMERDGDDDKTDDGSVWGDENDEFNDERKLIKRRGKARENDQQNEADTPAWRYGPSIHNDASIWNVKNLFNFSNVSGSHIFFGRSEEGDESINHDTMRFADL